MWGETDHPCRNPEASVLWTTLLISHEDAPHVQQELSSRPVVERGIASRGVVQVGV